MNAFYEVKNVFIFVVILDGNSGVLIFKSIDLFGVANLFIIDVLYLSFTSINLLSFAYLVSELHNIKTFYICSLNVDKNEIGISL